MGEQTWVKINLLKATNFTPKVKSIMHLNKLINDNFFPLKCEV